MPRAPRWSLACLSLLVGVAARAETLTWIAVDVAPAVILDGPLAGQGAEQEAGRVLERALPEFGWRFEIASGLRTLHEAESRDGICSFGFARLPDRERALLFGRRPMVVPGFGVILREDRLPDFKRFLDKSGAVDLSLMKGAGLAGGYVAGRPHFGAIRAFIEGSHDGVSLVSELDTANLFRQLRARRIDFLFGLRDETAYFAATLGGTTNFISLPVAGTDRMGQAYVACSIGPVGRKAMAALDRWLADDAHWEAFVGPWKRWLSPADYAAALTSPADPLR